MRWQMDKSKLLIAAIVILVAFLAVGLGVCNTCDPLNPTNHTDVRP